MAHSLLMIPVPELESVVRPRLERHSPAEVPTEPTDTAAHVTLLGPFADLLDIEDGMLSELRSFFADVLPFEFGLTAVCEFPGGTTYLSPEPSAPFRQLTHELYQRFPEFPPYGGTFDDVIPHLSVPIPEGEDVDKLRFELEPRFPIAAHALMAALYWWEPGACRTLESFPFGMTAA